MKKRIIALSVAAALGGVAGSALAQPAGQTLVFNPRGVGHILYVPYFSTQEGNVTAINIVNTDTRRGKVLKVRFRGASNSDDVYDFQVFLSPGDVWTAGISQAADGRSQLNTTDKSCTLPANVNGSFITTRIPAAGGVAETREGYVEILNMGDILDPNLELTTPNQEDLFDATKHVDGVAPCTSSVLTAITQENASSYLSEPTTGLMANWFIINVNRIFSYSGEAAAIEARTVNIAPGLSGLPAYGNIVYWDQRSTPLSQVQAEANTADPLLRGATPVITGARYDLPDMSTPYLPNPFFGAPGCPFCQARLLSDSIATTEAAAEFYSETTLGAQTDWVVSFPTRRYMAAVRYTGSGSPAAVYSPASENIYFTSANMELGSVSGAGKAYQLCAKLGVNAVGFYNREEKPTIFDDIVISPGQPTSLSLCGEVAVVGINNAVASNSATFGSVARSNVNNGFTEGWGFLTVPTSQGLPFLATEFRRINNTISNQYYGQNFPARIVTKGEFNTF